MSSEHLIVILALLNLGQLGFWGYHVHVLVNKTMSKNFAEYKLVKNGPPVVERTAESVEIDSEQEEILSELNGIFGKAN